MLLKIITNRNTTKVITGIEDAEIHNHAYAHIGTDSLVKGTENYPLPHGQNNFITEPEWYDDFPQAQGGPNVSEYVGHVVDYLKGGFWHRVVINQIAYLCNDEGKTIAKIG